jgi:hypothetical protein
MKDPERMNEEEKCRYIFEDMSFEGRPRFKWITDCLLGDIRTFLDGIEYFIIQNKGEPTKPLRGGGNLSVPILIHTALEFISRLYVGETKFTSREGYNAKKNVKEFIENFFPEKYRSIPQILWDGVRNGLVHTFSPKPFEYKGSYIRFQFYVEDQNFPSHIEKVKGYLFSIDAKLEANLNKGIVPEELKNNLKTKNLSFPEKPTVRNDKKEKKWKITDEEDTFYILEKEEEKLNIYNYTVKISINVFELYRILEKAVEAYRTELENSVDLQDKFIRAWSSVEENFQRKIVGNSEYRDDAETLCKYLDSNSSALLLKGLNDHLSADILKIYSFTSLKIRRS